MPAKESRGELESTSFSISSIRNNIIQKIQQSGQNTPEGESRQTTQAEGCLVQTTQDEECLAKTDEDKGHLAETDEDKGDLAETSKPEGCLAQIAQGEGHLAQTAQDEEASTSSNMICSTSTEQECIEDDMETNTEEFLMTSEMENPAVRTGKDKGVDTCNTVTLVDCHREHAHLYTVGDLELGSNDSYTIRKQIEHKGIQGFGAEAVAFHQTHGRQLSSPDAAAPCFDGEVDDAVLKVVQHEEATGDRTSQQSNSEVVIVKEKYRTQDRGSECDGEDVTSSDSDTDSSLSSLSDQKEDVTARAKGHASEQEEEVEKAVNKSCEGFEDIRTAGELFPEELPPIEELKIDVDANTHMEEVGQVSGVVGVLVVIHSTPGHSPVQDDTVFFLEDRTPIGQVFEVFGPVARPYYSVRFNTSDDIEKKGIKVGTLVYFAPHVPELTHYIFVEQLKRLKGSDASWKDNNEPPPEMVEYSDDEEERRVKAKRRARCANDIKEGEDPSDDGRAPVPALDSSTPAPAPDSSIPAQPPYKQPRNRRKRAEKDSSQTSSVSGGCWPPSDHSSKRFSGKSSGMTPSPSMSGEGPDPNSHNHRPRWRASGPGVLRGPVFSPLACGASLRAAAFPATSPLPNVSLPPPSSPYYNFTHIPPPPITMPPSQSNVPLGFSPQTAASFGAGPTFIQGPLQQVRSPGQWNPGFPSSAPCNPDRYPQGDWSPPPPFTANWTQNGQQQFTARGTSWAPPPSQQQFTPHTANWAPPPGHQQLTADPTNWAPPPGHQQLTADPTSWAPPGLKQQTGEPACGWGRQDVPNATPGLCGKTAAAPILDKRLINSSQR